MLNSIARNVEANAIECGSELMQLTLARDNYIWRFLLCVLLPFMWTKRKSIWAHDKMKLLLAVTVFVRECARQLAQTMPTYST